MSLLDVVLVHDPAEPPFDAWTALTDAGHRVAAHGAHVAGLTTFLEAMTWVPNAFVVDHRGRTSAARDVAAWLAAHPAWSRARLLAFPATAAPAPDGVRVVADAAALPAALVAP